MSDDVRCSTRRGVGGVVRKCLADAGHLGSCIFTDATVLGMLDTKRIAVSQYGKTLVLEIERATRRFNRSGGIEEWNYREGLIHALKWFEQQFGVDCSGVSPATKRSKSVERISASDFETLDDLSERIAASKLEAQAIRSELGLDVSSDEENP